MLLHDTNALEQKIAFFANKAREIFNSQNEDGSLNETNFFATIKLALSAETGKAVFIETSIQEFGRADADILRQGLLSAVWKMKDTYAYTDSIVCAVLYDIANDRWTYTSNLNGEAPKDAPKLDLTITERRMDM